MVSFDSGEYAERSMQALFMEVNKRYTAKCFQQIMELGIYPGQIPVLWILADRDGFSQRELAEQLRIKAPTINVTIQRLEKSGMVCRKQDENDQRVMRVYLTEKGSERIRQARIRIRKNEKLVFGNFSEAEFCLLRRFFQQIIENVNAMPGPSGKECMGKEVLEK